MEQKYRTLIGNQTFNMSTAAITLLIVAAFAQVHGAPNRCTDCNSITQENFQHDLSQKSARLEDFGESSDDLNLPSLNFNDRREGNWTDVNRYKTDNGNGEVHETQGQFVNGGVRVRYYKRNYTSSSSTGNHDFTTPDLRGFAFDRNDDSQFTRQRSNSAPDRLRSGNTYTGQESISSGTTNSRRNEYYNGGRFTGSSTDGQQGSWTVGLGSQTAERRPIGIDYGRGSGYDQSVGRGNSYITQSSIVRGNRYTGQDSQRTSNNENFGQQGYGGFNQVNTGGYTSNEHAYNSNHDLSGSDHSATRNWTRVNQYTTDGGRGTVYVVRGHYVTEPGHVYHYRKNYTTSYSGGDAAGLGLTLEDVRREAERDIERLLHSAHSLQTGSTQTYRQTGTFYKPSSAVESGHQRTVERVTNYGTRQEFQPTSDWEQISQDNSQRTQGTISSGRFVEAESRPQYFSHNQDTDESQYSQRLDMHNGQFSQGTQGIITIGQPSQSRHHERFTSSSSTIRNSDHSNPGYGAGYVQLGNNRGTHQTTLQQFENGGYNQRAHGSQRGATTVQQHATADFGNIYRNRNGQLVTGALDLGQIATDADCSECTEQQTSQRQTRYQSSSQQRVYKRDENHGQAVTQHLQQNEDLTQQNEDLTQQFQNIHDLDQQTTGHFELGSQHLQKPSKLQLEGQQTEQLTQQFTQQNEDLTQQFQNIHDLDQQTTGHFELGSQHTQKPSKLQLESQQTEQLTQQFTQQNEDLTQQFQNIHDLEQQTTGHFELGSQHTQKPSKLQLESQQTEQLTQQFTQQNEDLTQQFQNIHDFDQQTTGHFELGSQHPQKPSKLQLESQQTQQLTQQDEDLTQQFQNDHDLDQQTTGNFEFGSQHPQKPSKLQLESQQTEQLTQQFTQQNEDLTQQFQNIHDLDQQTTGHFEFGLQHPQKPSKLQLEGQQTEQLTQQNEDLTQQFQNIHDLDQQTTTHFELGSQHPQKPSKLQLESQQTEQLTQQFTQQNEDLTQQFQNIHDLDQQTTGHFELGSQHPQKPSKLQLESQQTEQLTQQNEDLTQQFQDIHDLDQQTTGHFEFGLQHPQKPSKLQLESQQTGQLTQQDEDLTQQFQNDHDLDQQTTGNFEFGLQHPQKPSRLQLESQQTQQLTQQNEDLTQQFQNIQDLDQQTTGHFELGSQHPQKPSKLRLEGQQTEQLTQQFTQQNEDLTQQFQNIHDLDQQTTGHFELGSQHTQKPSKLQLESQQTEQLTQQFTQQNEDLTQQFQNIHDFDQQTTGNFELGSQHPQKPSKLQLEGQQTEQLTQQNEDLTQQFQNIHDLDQQTTAHFELGSQHPQKPSKLQLESQQTEQLTQQFTQQNEDLTQQFQNIHDFDQQTTGHFELESQHPQKPSKLRLESQRTQQLTQQNEDLTQHFQNIHDLDQQTTGQFELGSQHTQKPSKLRLESQQTEQLTQQNEDLTQQFQNDHDLTQQITGHFDLGSQHTQEPSRLQLGNQQIEQLTQQNEDFMHQFQNFEDHIQQSSKDSQYTEQSFWNSGHSKTENSWFEEPQQFEISSQQTINNYNQQSRKPTTPAPKPGPFNRRPLHRVQPINVESTEAPHEKIPIMINYAQQNHQQWEQSEDLHQTAKATIVPFLDHKNGQKTTDESLISDIDFGTESIIENKGSTIPRGDQAPFAIPEPFEPEAESIHTTISPLITDQETQREWNQFHNYKPIHTPKEIDQQWHYTHHVGDLTNSEVPFSQIADKIDQHDQQNSYFGNFDQLTQFSGNDQQESEKPVSEHIYEKQHAGKIEFGQQTQTSNDFQQSSKLELDQHTDDFQQHTRKSEFGQQFEDFQQQSGKLVFGQEPNDLHQQASTKVEIEHGPVSEDGKPILFQPRILEAYGGGSGPFGNNANYAEAKQNPSATLAPEIEDAWDIILFPNAFRGREISANAPTINTPAPTITEPTTTESVTVTTTTAAPGFWASIGNKFTSGYDKAKEKAKEFFG